jgi:two-component system, sensor histidine kinase YesM
MRPYGRSLRVKILKSVFLTVVLPAFLVIVAFYVAWNMYVRERIEDDMSRSTESIARAIGGDLEAYDSLLVRLASERAVVAAFSSPRGTPGPASAMREIYALLQARRIKAVVGAVDSEGRWLFGTMGRPAEEDGKDAESGWGLYGLMSENPGRPVSCRRSMRYGKAVRTGFSLGLSVLDSGGGIIGYLTADLALEDWQEQSIERVEGVTGRFILTDEFDRVVASYDGSSIVPFDRFAIGGAGGVARLGGATYVYARRPAGGHGLSVYGLASIELIVSSFKFGLYTIGVVMALFCCVFAVVLYRSVSRMTRPISGILLTMEKVSQGDFSARLDVISGDEFEEIALRLNGLIAEMESTVGRLMERIELAKTAELRQLQAQFDPHFLYNTIDTAKWMIKMGEKDKACAVLADMAKVLRYSVHDKPAQSMIPIREDLEAIKTYLEIHKLSLGDSLSIEYDVDEAAMTCRIPKLLIQPLVENALTHGIGPEGGGRIGISIRSSGRSVVISVSDSGKGFAVALEEIARAERTEGGLDSSMGMSLVLRRARLYYGDRFSFDIRSEAATGSTITLTIPREAEEVPCTA